MRALRYEEGRLRVADDAVLGAPPSERDDEVTVRVLAAGICNTDLEITRGYANFEGTLGHEFVGVVEDDSPQAAPLSNRRVVGEINAGCGRCDLCLAGDPRHCSRRTVLGILGRDGAFAERLRLPLANLLEVPPEVSDECAVFTEPLAAACGVVERVPQIGEKTRVAIVGDGKLGLLCAQAVIALAGAQVTLIGKHPDKMRLAENRGAQTAHVGRAEVLARSFDVAIEASGASAGFETAVRLLRPRGTLVLKSTFHGTTPLNQAPLVVDELSVVGSRCGRFAPALDLLRRGAVDVGSLVTDIYALADGVEAVRRAAQPGVMKVLLRVNQN